MKPTFTIGYLPILDHLILPIAEKNNGPYFENLTLKTRMFKNWGSLERAIVQQKINGAFIFAPLAMKLYHDYHGIKVVLLGHREGQVLVIKRGINDIEELKGKTVFIPHTYSTHHLLLSRILQDAGLSIKDIQLTIGSPNIKDAVDQLAQDKIQAFIIAEPMGTEARQRRVGTIAALSHRIKTHHIDCILVLHKELVNDYKDACQELVDSLVKAGMFINAYPRQAAEIGEDFLQFPKKLLLEALTHDKGHILYWDLLPRSEDFEELQDIAISELKLWETPINLKNFICGEFAQTAYRDWVIDLRRATKDKGESRTLPGSFKEGAILLKKIFHRSIPIFGIQLVNYGWRYPKGIKKIETLTQITPLLVKQVFEGGEYLIKSKDEKRKAVAFLQISSCVEPTKVCMQLMKQEASRCYNSLHFGKGMPQFKHANPHDFQNYFIEGDEVIMVEYEDTIWCSMGYNVFRFLTLMLRYF